MYYALRVSRIWKIRYFLRDDLFRTHRCKHIWHLVTWARFFEFPATHWARVFDPQTLEQTSHMKYVTTTSARDIRISDAHGIQTNAASMLFGDTTCLLFGFEQL
jgi:hypothetical protein